MKEFAEPTVSRECTRAAKTTAAFRKFLRNRKGDPVERKMGRNARPDRADPLPP